MLRTHIVKIMNLSLIILPYILTLQRLYVSTSMYKIALNPMYRFLFDLPVQFHSMPIKVHLLQLLAAYTLPRIFATSNNLPPILNWFIGCYLSSDHYWWKWCYPVTFIDHWFDAFVNQDFMTAFIYINNDR